MVFLMFKHGYSYTAREKLLEIMEKNIANRGFFEWDDRKGTGQGSDFFCGSAGSLSKAVVEGYFGIKLNKDSLSIDPKLGTDSGKIHIYQPANDIFVAYEYIFDSDKNIITLKYNSNFPKVATLKILIPPSLTRDYDKLGDTIKLKIDGRQTPITIESRHNDVFIEFQTDLKYKTAVISLN